MMVRNWKTTIASALVLVSLVITNGFTPGFFARPVWPVAVPALAEEGVDPTPTAELQNMNTASGETAPNPEMVIPTPAEVVSTTLQTNPLAASSDTKTVFLPLLFKSYPRAPSMFGVETNYLSTANKIGTTSTYWLRNFAFDWSSIESSQATPAVYNWSSVDEAGLINARFNQTALIATIKYTPAWAQKYPGVLCGPPSEAALDRYAQFLQAAVRRYSVSPYFVHYWEIGNEVDVDYHMTPNSPFGCWGDTTDPYYGGGYYATVLKKIYPAIKAVDPQAQVLLGGLLLDCDPDHPPAGKDCKSSKYLEGILKNGGGPYFDIVSFHSYSYYVNGKIDENVGNWSVRGGMFMGKIRFLREVLAAYSVSKPLLMTEMSLVCPETSPGCSPVSDDFKERQADYIYWVYLRAWNEGLQGAIWYTFEDSGWRSSGLYMSSSPKPAFYSYQYLSTTLNGATLVGPLSQYPALSGFEFRLSNKRIWVLWAPDQVAHTITLPSGVTAVKDKYGKDLPLSANLSVLSPIVIELVP
jgi:hypothetical protein